MILHRDEPDVMAEQTPLQFVFYFAAPPDRVWDGFVSPESNRIIFGGAELEVALKRGGAMNWVGPGPDGKRTVYVRGEVLQAQPPRLPAIHIFHRLFQQDLPRHDRARTGDGSHQGLSSARPLGGGRRCPCFICGWMATHPLAAQDVDRNRQNVQATLKTGSPDTRGPRYSSEGADVSAPVGRMRTSSSRAPASSNRRGNAGRFEPSARAACSSQSNRRFGARARDLEQALRHVIGHFVDPFAFVLRASARSVSTMASIDRDRGARRER